MLGRDRDRLAEPKLVGFEHAGPSCPALALVGDHDGGLARSAHEIGKNSIFRHRACARIDQEQYRIGGGKRGLGLLLHARGQAFGRGLLEARRVDHGEVEIAEPRAALPPIAGDAGAVIDQCKAFADEAVEQRRLADIRPADNGDREAHDRTPRARRYASSTHYSVVDAAVCPVARMNSISVNELNQRVAGGSGQATPPDGCRCVGGGSGHCCCDCP